MVRYCYCGDREDDHSLEGVGVCLVEGCDCKYYEMEEDVMAGIRGAEG